MTTVHTFLWLYLISVALISRSALAYDPNDTKIASVIPPEGYFEAFYPREMDGVPNSASRPAHAHGSFFKHRNPALVDTKNAAAYGYRFDGKRRFNLK
ncbi:PREDICTED: uncharacterized protein LOC108362712 [Rhagoletis zephyria]|uniref:uncharacterized protein LOC108362712 n=1 Tax=Rhagoletis zephyria TaxID=28612 RepID=UPI0008116A92|nr:PREDICTED: uncharacterized protein LOC108362712 [Rhagoletis zephyria]XP_017471300.1 PREDICTED: uncharacterized protein LOC108362712 [Rhagoletis zephyria]